MLNYRPNTACVINYGCQMNEYESLTVQKMLQGAGFEIIDDDEQAEIVLLNTCTVRDNADQRVWHKLEHLLPQKRKSRGKKKIGLLGCMVAAQKEAFKAKHPQIDFLIAPSELQKIHEVLADVTAREFQDYSVYEMQNEGNPSPFRSFMPIQTGCNFNCTYCIVPSVKGREVNLEPDSILAKIDALCKEGVLEITLLGQTINSYRCDDLKFADLLEKIAIAFPQIWIRFLTSHPVLFETKILEVVARYPNLCPYFHIPAQSGSNAVLQAMKRGYTREKYLDLTTRMREMVPGAVLSTDMICGFPAETEADFEDTLDLVRKVKFETAFLFYYSEREGTKATEFKEQVPVEIRKSRLERLIVAQRQNQAEIYENYIGQVQDVLVESVSRRSEYEFKGRNQGNLPVIFEASGNPVGSFARVRILKTSSHSLFGTIV